jgi:hypothetical protein
MTSGSWMNNVNLIINEYLVERRQHLYSDHSITNPAYPDNAKIPAAQVGNPAIQFGQIEVNPASGNQNQEYVQLVNPNATAVDISNWRIEGGIRHTFTPGTVIPAGGSMYITPSVPDFLARTTGPRGGQKLFVQGNYSGVLKDAGEEPLRLVAADGTFIAQVQQAVPGDYDEDLKVDNLDYDVWRSNFGSTTVVNGDGNANGIVDAADYVLWRRNVGTSLAAAASTSRVIVAAVSSGTDVSDESSAAPIASQSPAQQLAFSLLDSSRQHVSSSLPSITGLRQSVSADVDHDMGLLAVLDIGHANSVEGIDHIASDTQADSHEISAFESIDDLFAALTI